MIILTIEDVMIFIFKIWFYEKNILINESRILVLKK